MRVATPTFICAVQVSQMCCPKESCNATWRLSWVYSGYLAKNSGPGQKKSGGKDPYLD